MCADSLVGVPSTSVLPRWYVKTKTTMTTTGHSVKKKKSAGPVTPKHAYVLDPAKSEWADYASVQAYSGKELTRNSAGNTRPQSSQLAEPLWTDLAERVELVRAS